MSATVSGLPEPERECAVKSEWGEKSLSQCESCAAENREGARFCTSCGEPLEVDRFQSGLYQRTRTDCPGFADSGLTGICSMEKLHLATGRWAEAIFRNRKIWPAIWEAAERGAHEAGDFTLVDAARIVAVHCICVRVPVNTIGVLECAREGEMLSWREIDRRLGSDALAMFDIDIKEAVFADRGEGDAAAVIARGPQAVAAGRPNPQAALNSVSAMVEKVQERDARATGAIGRLAKGAFERAGLHRPNQETAIDADVILEKSMAVLGARRLPAAIDEWRKEFGTDAACGQRQLF